MNDLETFKKSSITDLLYKDNSNLYGFESLIKKEEYLSFKDILKAHNIVLDRIDERELELNKKLVEINEDLKIRNECDKWDYIFASSAGVLAGLVDSFFVGSPKDSKWLSSADSVMDNLVQKFAKLNGWNGPKENSDPTKSAIGYLEKAFKVNYDHRHSSDVSGLFTMAAVNHHLKSLSHSPSPIGLIFSIIDQFKGTATFLDNGYLITVDSESNLQGSNFPSKLFAAFINWIGHIMSDIAGSSGASGRGSGIPIPFYELLQSLNIGSFGNDKKSLAEIAVKVFEQGYDFRFGMVQSIPVVMVELFVRVFCIIRHRFQYNRSWADCLQFLNFDRNARLKKMLLVGQGTLCLVDAGDAFIRSGFAQNWVEFFSRLNFVAWMRFSYLALRQSIALLKNEIEIQRYKLRAEAYNSYVEDVNHLVNNFLIEHNKKIERFFLERKKELTLLLNSLENALDTSDHHQATKIIGSIASIYEHEDRFNDLDEFEKFMMEND
ncbi:MULTISPECIES: hypothetical protein [unclassified Pasteurella]|uniref:hypothetical protein n=1 Tax=unclassified Pasteurella TaxID=2621516 RepID=UPI0010730FE7|nr:hypothetical protein [Pasteurella sp. 19428wF3_WM03]TFU52566.1 hypothetical protein E4T92_03525 [Pasteurella sp. WM03]